MKMDGLFSKNIKEKTVRDSLCEMNMERFGGVEVGIVRHSFQEKETDPKEFDNSPSKDLL
jgi:hypothetical protein